MCWWTVSPLLVAPAEMGARAVYSSTCATGEAASASQRCVSIEFQLQGHRGSPPVWGLAFWAMGSTRVWPLVGSVAACPALPGRASRPPLGPGSHTSVPAGRQQPGSSGIAALANTLQTAQPPLCPPTSPAVPALPPAAEPGAGGAIPPLMNPAGVAGCPQTGRPDGFACGPLRKRIDPVSPGEKTRRQVEQI